GRRRAARPPGGPGQAVLPGDPPDDVLPRAIRSSRGRVSGLRGRCRALDRAAVLPGDDRGPDRPGGTGADRRAATVSTDDTHGSDQHGRITGRGFRSRQDDAFRALNDSIGFDWRAAPSGGVPGARFRARQDDAFRALNDSIGFDWRLAPYDVDQSIAHATMLAAQGIIGDDDRGRRTRGLE